MRITAFNGSPRRSRGNTHRLVATLMKGMASSGAETTSIQLVDRNVNHCTGCFACWDRIPGTCVQKDDAAALLDLFHASDLVVLATWLIPEALYRNRTNENWTRKLARL